jgi:serine/threonine protein kinase
MARSAASFYVAYLSFTVRTAAYASIVSGEAVAGPTLIGRFEILAELGQGAMGLVLKARDPELDRLVALKSLRPDLGLPSPQLTQMKKRFQREAMAAGRLNHPGIVTIYDVLEIDGTPYIVMEYVEGRTLAELLATEGPLSPHRAVETVLQVCDALEYAHRHRVIHRDIKPANVLVTPSGVVKVSDFGIARIAAVDVTQTAALLGTPSYMAPEQVRGEPTDHRTDLFSLGAALYEMVSGERPFRGDNLAAVAYQVVHADPVSVRKWNPAVSPALDAVIQRVLAKEPEQRYQDARAFADALAAALDSSTSVGPRPTPIAHRQLRPLLIGAASVVLVIAVGWTLWSPSPARDTGSEVSRRGNGPGSPGPVSSSGPSESSSPTPRRQPDPRQPKGPTPSPLTLAPSTPKAKEAIACLSVNAVPFARVYANGRYVGDTPRACLRIPVGEYRVYFEAEDQRSPERLVQLGPRHTADDPLRLSYDFKRRQFLE